MKKQNLKLMSGLRSKLMAAIAMVLVSTLMLVGSTYAWFTLSTAPEITGITTSVGANGNLEIALLQWDPTANNGAGGLKEITSSVGDSMAVKDATEANITWGNLIDLSDANYGLSAIQLMPSRLNAKIDGGVTTLVGNSLLSTPIYGNDGRVKELNANTVTGTYADGKFTYNASNVGVRAIGTSADMTDRQIAYGNTLAAVRTNMTDAKNEAATALSNNAQKLAKLMAVHANNADATFTANEYREMIEGLKTGAQAANDKVAVAIKNAIIAYVASNTTAVNDDAFTTFYNAVKADTVTVANTVTAANTAGIASLPNAFTTAITRYGNVNSALSNLVINDSWTGTATLGWADIDAYLEPLVKASDITAQNKDGNWVGLAELGSGDAGYLLTKGLNMRLAAESGGAYADLGALVGNYSAKTTVDPVDLAGVNVGATVDAGISTNASVNYVAACQSAVGGMPAGTLTNGNAVIRDTYGYALDFAFRTNAAGSTLRLQTAEKQRIYTDSNNPETLGGGSYMIFSSEKVNNASVLTEDQIINLMKAIRVVFVDADSSSSPTIVGVACLDVYNIPNSDKVDGAVKAPLKLVAYTIGTGTDSVGGVLSIDKTAANIDANGFKTGTEGSEGDLCALTQSTVKKLSVVVYLDGDMVENDDVANAVASMKGKMNLQFSSSAELIPMDNSQLNTQSTPATPASGS